MKKRTASRNMLHLMLDPDAGVHLLSNGPSRAYADPPDRPGVGRDRGLPGHAMAILAKLLVYSVGDTLTQCDPCGITSTSHWTGAAIIVQCSPTKNCIATRPRTSPKPMPSSLGG